MEFLDMTPEDSLNLEYNIMLGAKGVWDSSGSPKGSVRGSERENDKISCPMEYGSHPSLPTLKVSPDKLILTRGHSVASNISWLSPYIKDQRHYCRQ